MGQGRVREVWFAEKQGPKQRKEFIVDPALYGSARKEEDWEQNVPVNLVLYIVGLLAKTKCEHKNCLVYSISKPTTGRVTQVVEL